MPDGLAHEAGRGLHQPGGHDAVVQHGALAGVEIVEEAVQRGDALNQTPFDEAPLVGRDDPGDQVHRPGALDALGLAVDGEGDAAAPEDRVAQQLAALEVARREAAQTLDQLAVVRARAAFGVEDLVEEGPALVAVEQVGRHRSPPPGRRKASRVPLSARARLARARARPPGCPSSGQALRAARALCRIRRSGELVAGRELGPVGGNHVDVLTKPLPSKSASAQLPCAASPMQLFIA